MPAPLEAEPIRGPLKVAVVTEPGDLGGARLHPTVAEALKQAAGWLAEAGYEIVDTPTPGFTRAMDTWFAMQMPEIRRPCGPPSSSSGTRASVARWA